MKLLQLNLWMGRLTRQILPLIEREQPDIITAQEVFSSPKPIPFPDTLYDIHERIAALGYDYVYFSPVCSTSVSGHTVQFGNALYSKLPLENTRTIFTSGAFCPDTNGSEFDTNSRNAQLATVRVNGRIVHIVNHHGYWEPNPIGSEKTVAAMRVVADTMEKLEGPIIFSGDLNVNPSTPALQLFDGWLEDLTATYGLNDTLTVLGKVQGVAPDHIFVSNEIKVRSFAVMNDVASDHKALLLEFDFYPASE